MHHPNALKAYANGAPQLKHHCFWSERIWGTFSGPPIGEARQETVAKRDANLTLAVTIDVSFLGSKTAPPQTSLPAIPK